MDKERVFSEQEVAQIIKRAAEITEEGAEPTYVPGVTREELEKIAAEVGVSASALERAINEARERTHKRGPLRLTEEFERVVDGELDPSQFDVVLEGVKTFGRGEPTLVGRSLRADAWTGAGQAHIDVTSRNGRTKLKVKSNAFFEALMTLYPSFIATAITVGTLSAKGMGLLGAAIGAGVMTVGGLLCGKLIKVGHRNAERLADDIQSRIAGAVAEQGPVAQAQVSSERPPVSEIRATPEVPVEQSLNQNQGSG